jgi:hypothetical protein
VVLPEAIELTIKTPSGRAASQLLYRYNEPQLQVAIQRRTMDLPGDAEAFRLISEAHRIGLAGRKFDRLRPKPPLARPRTPHLLHPHLYRARNWSGSSTKSNNAGVSPPAMTNSPPITSPSSSLLRSAFGCVLPPRPILGAGFRPVAPGRATVAAGRLDGRPANTLEGSMRRIFAGVVLVGVLLTAGVARPFPGKWK